MYHRTSNSRGLSAAQSRYGFRSREWSDQSLGTILVAYREAYGKSVEDVADDLCIRRIHIRALENATYGDLPEQSYASGFVRSYAKYLGLPPEEMVARFRESYRDHADKHAPPPRLEALATANTVSYSPRWPSFAVLLIAAVLLGSSYMVMAAYTAATNPIPQTAEISSSDTLEYVSPAANFTSADTVLFDDIEIELDIDLDPPIEPAAALDPNLDPINITEEIDGDLGETLVYGIGLPQNRPDSSSIEPEPLVRTDQQHRVVIEATGRAFLTVLDDATGEAFLRAEYQRGDKYSVPDDKIVRLLSLNVDRLEIRIDGVPYRVSPAIAALNEPLVLDPDVIPNTNDIIPIE